MKHSIKKISAKETYAVRLPVLREGKPIESCMFDGDDLETTIHLGIFCNKKIVGVCSFLKNKNHVISDENQFQLRGMAILKAFQKKGLGKLLLDYGESELRKRKSEILWCNARETAVIFYKKCGFQVTGQPFDIETVGLHYTMYKKL